MGAGRDAENVTLKFVTFGQNTNTCFDALLIQACISLHCFYLWKLLSFKMLKHN